MAAFAGHGELAFVSRGRLWVLDGAAGTVRQVATSGMTPVDPAFSRDGRWLAFLANSPSGQAQTVWLARGDGSDAHKIVASGGLIGWSPASDVLAVEAGNAIQLLGPGSERTARPLTRAAGVWSAVWSPDGRDLAVATRRWPSATTLASYPAGGGRPTVWLRLNARSGVLNGMHEVIIDPAGWWPHWGIGFWVFGDGMVHNNDQTPLDVISAPGARSRLLGYTLSDGSAPQAAAAPDGWLAIVNNPDLHKVGRILWQDKRVEACSPAGGRCATVPTATSSVTLDPAWSPDGSRLAYVQAPSRVSSGFPQKVAAAWYGAHQLWLYDPATHSARRLNADGASVPAWSPDGNSLLYVARDAIWLLPRLGGRPVRIAGPLYPLGNWPDYYGQVNWASQFAWWPGRVPVAASPARSAGASRVAACATSQLKIAFIRTRGYVMGQEGGYLRFANRGPTCQLSGWPTVLAVTAAGKTITVARALHGTMLGAWQYPSRLPVVRLRPGASAYAIIAADDQPGGASPCTHVRSLQVTSPSGSGHVTLSARLWDRWYLPECPTVSGATGIQITAVEPPSGFAR